MSTERSDYNPHTHRPFRGHAEVIIGPMFAGKTEKAITRLNRHRHAKKRCLFIKHEKDNRYSPRGAKPSASPQVVTKSKYVWDGDTIECGADILTALEKALAYDVVAVDEGQFFDGIAPFADTLATQGVIVIITYLQSSFERTPMGEMATLLSISRITQCFSVCQFCGSLKALFSKRTSSSPVKRNEFGELLMDIGGEEKYAPSCRACFDD